MIIAAIWAPMIQYFGGIWVYLQQMYAIFVPPIVVLFGWGFDKKEMQMERINFNFGNYFRYYYFYPSAVWNLEYSLTINAGIVVALVSDSFYSI